MSPRIYTVFAEPEGGPRRFMDRFTCKYEARVYVEELDNAGRWPTGNNAILVDEATGEQWLLSDEWEPMS